MEQQQHARLKRRDQFSHENDDDESNPSMKERQSSRADKSCQIDFDLSVDPEREVAFNKLNIEVVKLRDRVADLEIERAKRLARYTEEKERLTATLEAKIERLKADLNGNREVVSLREQLVRRHAEIMSLTRQLNAKLTASSSSSSLQTPPSNTTTEEASSAASATDDTTPSKHATCAELQHVRVLSAVPVSP